MDKSRMCGDCEFWEAEKESEDGSEDGTCHRFPPVLNPPALQQWADDIREEGKGEYPNLVALSINSGCWSQPTTWAFDWCGEWKPAPPAEGGQADAAISPT